MDNIYYIICRFLICETFMLANCSYLLVLDCTLYSVHCTVWWLCMILKRMFTITLIITIKMLKAGFTVGTWEDTMNRGTSTSQTDSRSSSSTRLGRSVRTWGIIISKDTSTSQTDSRSSSNTRLGRSVRTWRDIISKDTSTSQTDSRSLSNTVQGLAGK